MTLNVPKKVYSIFERLKSSKYIGDIRCNHFAVAIRAGKLVTPVGYNYSRTMVFGEIRGTLHAEMNILSYIFNTDKSISGFNVHRSSLCFHKLSQFAQRKKVCQKV
jgi:hypothetical protein